jgi:hypothetical protein
MFGPLGSLGSWNGELTLEGTGHGIGILFLFVCFALQSLTKAKNEFQTVHLSRCMDREVGSRQKFHVKQLPVYLKLP